MSFYRTFIAAITAMGLASTVFAADANKEATTQNQHPAVAAAQADAAHADKININKATAKEFAAVKGLSVTKAKAIVSYRKKHGDFKSLDGLKDVKGFKRMDEKTRQDIEAQLTIG